MASLLLLLLTACVHGDAAKVGGADDTGHRETTATDTSASDTGTPTDTASLMDAPGTFLDAEGVVFTDIAVKGAFACATTANGRVFCWNAVASSYCHQPPRRLRSSDVTLWGTRSESPRACAVDRATLNVVCWDWEGGPTRVAAPGPFTEVDGRCGLRANGTINCWEDFTCSEAPTSHHGEPPEGVFVALDTRQSGAAIDADGNMQLWGPYTCTDGKGECYQCGPRVTIPGPFTAVSNTWEWGSCALREAGGIACEAVDDRLSDVLPSDGVHDSLDAAFFANAPGVCTLDDGGVVSCWGPDIPATSERFAQIVADQEGFYGRTEDGEITAFAAGRIWQACLDR